MHSADLNFTFPFQKINQEQRIVTGIATADNPDLVDDVVNFDASVEAFSNWIGNIREMHSPVAVGKLVDWKPVSVVHEGETYQGIEVSVYISKGAESTWQKILDGTLRGFSIGGNVVKTEKKKSEKLGRYINEIMNYRLGELSVVDNPCNPAGMFAMIKSIDGQLEYVAESVQDVFYCEDDHYVSVGAETICPVCDDDMIIIGRSEDYDEILINKFIDTINDSFEKALSDINTVPTDAMAAEARRGLEWRKEFNRGGTPVGVARARDVMNKDTLSISTVRRMHSFFSRHEVDKQGKGFTPGDGYPSAGRIAWALWGGDPGQTWARAITNRIKAMEKGVGTDVDGMNIDGPGDLSKAPAPPSDRISGSERNEPGSASSGSGSIEVSSATESALQTKLNEHNEKMREGDRPSWTRVTLGSLKAVYRRGAGAFSVSHRPGMNRNQWALARVNAFLYLARTGSPKNTAYTTDYDLLTSDHPKSTKNKSDDIIKDDYMCKSCGDTGYIRKAMECPYCDGDGEMPDGEMCDYCDGDGYLGKGVGCPMCKAVSTGQIGAGGGGIKKPQQGLPDPYLDNKVNKMMPTPDYSQAQVIDALRKAAGDVAIMYTHAHGYHWNVRGSDFAQYHELFGLIYSDVYNSIDPLVENILKMGGPAPRGISEFLTMATMEDDPSMDVDPEVLSANLAEDNDAVINSLNNVFKIANAVNQQGVCNFVAERIDQHQTWAWQLKVSDEIYETEDTGEESMVSKDSNDLQLTKNYDIVNDMSQEDFTDTQKETILSKLGNFLFGKEIVEKGQVIDVNNMNHTLRIVSEGDMSQAPRVVVNVGGGMLEEYVGDSTAKQEVINSTPSENVVGGDEALTGQGSGEFALQTVKKSEDIETSQDDVTEGEEEMDFEKVLEGLGALLDEKLEKVKADITADIDGKIESIEKSVSEVKESAEELTSDLEKVANSGAEKKSADVDADEMADDDVLEKSVESESFWGGMFVPAEIVKVLGYNS